MPLALSKLPCGVIYTDKFRDFLTRLHDLEAPAHPWRILTLDYLRCASGPHAGQAWWQVTWEPLKAVPDYRQYRIGSVPVHIPKAAQHGLRERCLDFENGHVVVKP
ncbi:MAG: hypothetical protein ACOYMN_11835 [Roseimicrobium sp.]